MSHAEYLPFEHSGSLNRLLIDYLHRKNELREFYSEYPDLEGFNTIIKANPYQALDRQTLSNLLNQQASSVNNTSEASLANIQLLANPNTYTVTTGHQLCLFTGPFYFISKLFSAINLAEELSERFPAQTIVPVYWMATEDHDFAEVNHFYVNDEKLEWHKNPAGAVGNFQADQDLINVFEQFKSALGTSANAKYLTDLFQQAYLKQANLGLATRYIVNELFGKYGLVIIDGNDKGFKSQFTAEMTHDLYDQTAHKAVTESSAKLAKLNYHSQVNAREINLFLLSETSRKRIERFNQLFKIHDESKFYSASEIELLIKEQPEVFSPNVILRPLYQQKILPNLAYVGGPGELAYWLQLKALFDQENIVFPILVPRSFVTMLPKRSWQHLQTMNLPLAAIYQPHDELIKSIQTANKMVFSLETEEQKIAEIFEKIKKSVTENDRSLETKVAADLQRTRNALHSIAAKVNRSRRRKMTEESSKLEYIKRSVFANTTPRERHDNFSAAYLTYGPNLFDDLKKHCKPLLLEQLVLIDR